MSVISKIKLDYFIYGFLFMSSMNSLHQDMLGMEKYIDMVRAGWITPWITVPMALAMMIFIIANVATDKR